MNFDIKNIHSYSIQTGKQYFLDANIWLKVLRPKIKPSNLDEKYQKIFKDIVLCEFSQIIVTSLLFSEVINRYMRDVSMRKFASKNGVKNPDSSYFKTVYRPTDQYSKDYRLLLSEIDGYSESFILKNDEFGSTVTMSELKEFASSLDFNDSYYLILSKKHQYIIVTDDGDFMERGVRIVTGNRKLIEKANSLVLQQ